MASFVTPVANDDAIAEHVAQLTENFQGLRNIPISLTGINDAASYALSIKNVGTGAKGAIIYAADGTTILFQADANGVKASVDGVTPAATIITAAGAVDLTNKTYAATHTGAVAAARFVGGIASGTAPLTGTFAVGDIIEVNTGGLILCTVAGTPGTWVQVGASALTKIAEVVLSGTAATIAFSGIPGTYRNLVLDGYLRGDTAATDTPSLLQFNGDSSAIYDWQEINANAGTPSAVSGNADTSIRLGAAPANTALANTFGPVRIIIPHYANAANHKTMHGQSAYKTSNSAGNMVNYVLSGWWRNVAAITTVTLSLGAGNFQIGSLVVLYGES